MTDSIIARKSYNFARKIIRLYKYLCTHKKEYVLAKQVLRSGTSIGANVKEALRGQSRRDFLSKMNIALKEADDTEYWLELLIDEKYIDKERGKEILSQCKEICRILNSIVKTVSTQN